MVTNLLFVLRLMFHIIFQISVIIVTKIMSQSLYRGSDGVVIKHLKKRVIIERMSLY